MKTILPLLLLPILILLAGCTTLTGTVENSLSFVSPTGEKIDVAGHKDTTIEGLKITKPDGTEISFDKYQSVGNAGAIEQAGSVERASQLTNQTMLSMMTALVGRMGPIASTVPPPTPAPAPEPPSTESTPAAPPAAPPAAAEEPAQ